MPSSLPATGEPVAEVLQEASEIVEQVSAYGSLITNSLYLIVGGMLAVFLLHKLTSKFLYPYIKKPRLMRVVFGTLYVLILVVTMLVVLNKLGIETSVIGKVTIMVVLASAVVIFFLIPFLPRLPFKTGQMIEVNGVLGNVEGISYAHTTIRTFDGAMVFIPNPVVLASRIVNYHDIPERRIGFKLTVNLDADIEELRRLILAIINADKRVLSEPVPPVVRVTTATANGIELVAFCWVKNDIFLDAQSDLWIKLVAAVNSDERVRLSSPQQNIRLTHVANEDSKKV
jgi:small conductance mechanosensitive channel